MQQHTIEFDNVDLRRIKSFVFSGLNKDACVMICVEQQDDEVFIACDKTGAKKLIEVLTDFIERDVPDHEHLTEFDGLSMERVSEGSGFSVASILHVYYRPS